MAALLLAVASIVLVGLVCLMFVAWALREHAIANMYRELSTEYQKAVKDLPAPGTTPIKPKDGWTIVYKVGKVTKSITVKGNTEGEALNTFTKCNTRYDNIISIER